MKKRNPILLCLLAFALFSCNKSDVEVDNESQSAVDGAVAEQEFMAVLPAVLQSAANSMSNTIVLRCDTLSKISGDTLWETSGHIDPTYTMSASGCQYIFPDGKTRSGSVKMRFTGNLHNAGTKAIIKLENYVSGGITFSCDSMIVTTVSVLPSVMDYTVKLINGLCQTPNYKIKYTMERTVTDKDAYTQAYGTASGVNREGRVFTLNIPQSSPLVKQFDCSYIGKGIMEITPNGFKTRKVNFGNGTCDENATFEVNGNTIAFGLK